jgi:hypothetical protein
MPHEGDVTQGDAAGVARRGLWRLGPLEVQAGHPLAGREDRAVAEHQHVRPRGHLGPRQQLGDDLGTDPARVAEHQADARFGHVCSAPLDSIPSRAILPGGGHGDNRAAGRRPKRRAS